VNRQTLAVTLGTVALVLFGILLLYAAPDSDPSKLEPVADAAGVGKAKSEKADKAKADGPRKLQEAKLVHATEIPADRVAAPAGAPNVVLVVPTTQRRDQWSVYGGPETTTPFLAKKAAKGVTMMDALSVAVDPKPSDVAILTGVYPHKVGVIETAEKRNNRALSPDANTLAERLAGAGWFTVGLTANHNVNARLGGSQGFDWYRDSQPYSMMVEQRIDASDLVDKALERVGARTDAEKKRPIFLQLAFIDSHKPFKVPPAEFQPFAGENGEVAPYRATLKRLDDALQKLADGLATNGITDENTIWVVVADHGEGLDMPVEHRKQHGFVLYESAVRIPWVLWGKGIPEGGKVEGLASQIDVAPTLLALAGVTKQTGFDGLDLSPAVLGKGASTREKAYADTHYEGVHRASIWTATRQCQKDYGSKEIEDDAFVNGCYDRKADPNFTKTVPDEALAAELEKMHDELMKKVEESSAPAAEGEPEAADGAG
jgi:arylsulfatase A-like enzyme